MAIEVDGSQHLEQEIYDRKRAEALEDNGIKVLRFWNNDVLLNIEAVIEVIWKEVEARPRWS